MTTPVIDRPPRVARGEGEDKELALVAELGDEDGAEGEGDGAEELGHRDSMLPAAKPPIGRH